MRNATLLARLALRRMNRQRLLSAAVPSALAATAIAGVCVLVARALGSPGVEFAVAAFIAAFLASAALLLRVAPRASMGAAAAEIDERLKLEGRIASALALASRTDPFARAAVEDGERAAGAPGMSRMVRAAFPMRWPSAAAWVPVAMIAVALLAWMVPPRASRQAVVEGDSGSSATVAEAVARAEQAEQRVQQAVQAIEASPEAQERLKDLLATVTDPKQPTLSQESGVEAADAEGREAEAARRAATIEERLERELDSEEMMGIEGLRDALARLPESSDKARDLSQALKVGDLDAAMKQLESLSQQAAGSDPKAAEAAKQALESIASAIEKAAAQGSPAMQQALKQAGLDPSLAKDPAAAKAAIEAAKQAGKLSAQQASELQKQAQKQQQAHNQAKELAKATRECKSGSCSSARSATSRAQAQQRMNVALKMAMSNCRNPSQLGWSMPWQRGSQANGSQGNGSGQGGGSGPGGGKGGSKAGQNGAPKTDGNTKALAEGALAETQESAGDGNPLDQAAARDFVRAQGVPVGVSTEQVKAVAAKVSRGLEEASDEDPVPGRLKAAHKRYFDQWKRKLDAAAPAAGGTDGKAAPSGAKAAPAPAGSPAP